jgi:hypothetical protein
MIQTHRQHGDLVSLTFILLKMKLPNNSCNTSALTTNIFMALRTVVSELSSPSPS